MILTPVYPVSNTTHNVIKSTLSIIKEEIKRGYTILKTLPTKDANIWKELVQPTDFFLKHKHYIQMIISANTKQDLVRWHGWCESRIRYLVIKLQLIPGIKVYPHPESYIFGNNSEGFFIGLEFDKKVINQTLW